MEIVLPGHLTVVESHDLALELQHKIESLIDVERAFVHVSSSFVLVFHLLSIFDCTGGSSASRWIRA